MCFSEQQAKMMLKEFKMDQKTLVDELSVFAGSQFDYGPNDFSLYENRLNVMLQFLRGTVKMLENRFAKKDKE
jgi:hypothetical protein